MIPALGYTRVSSEQQAGDTRTSLEDQRAAISVLAARVGAEVVQWFTDPGVSGATIRKRPGITALIDYCHANKRKPSAPGFVLILNDSRLGRFDDPEEAAWLRVELKQVGWVVRFAEADDIEDPTMRSIMRAVGSAQASEYRRNLRANTTRGRMGTTRQGFWTSRPPFGYLRKVVHPEAQARVLPHGVPKAKGERIKLVPSTPEEVQLVQDIFSLYATGAWSMKRLLRMAIARDQHGMRPLQWNGVTIRNILENEVYLGHIPARRRTATRMELGDYNRAAAEFVVRNTHEALIDQETFDQCQAQLQQVAPRGDVQDYRVRSLVTCVYCGEPYVGGGSARRRVNGHTSIFYIDRGGRDKKCGPPAGAVSRHLLERAVIDGFAAHLATQLKESTIRKALSARLRVVEDKHAPRVSIDSQIADAEQRKNRLLDAIERDIIVAAEAAPRLAKLRDELTRLQQLQDAQSSTVVTPTTVSNQLDRLVRASRDIPKRAARASGPELRAMLAPWIHSMTFDRSSRVLSMQCRSLADVLTAQTFGVQGFRDQVSLIERRIVVKGTPGRRS